MDTCTKCRSDFTRTPSQIVKCDHICWPCHYASERVRRVRESRAASKGTIPRRGRPAPHAGDFDALRESLEELAMPVPETGCWLWIGKVNNAGYGRIGLGSRGRAAFAHRVSFQIHRGPIPAGMLVCHRCDTRSCINPDHLFVGSAADNTADMLKKGRGRWQVRVSA